MLFSSLNTSASLLPIDCMVRTLMPSHYVVGSATAKLKASLVFSSLLQKSVYLSINIDAASSLTGCKTHSNGVTYANVVESYEQKVMSDLSDEKILTQEVQMNDNSNIKDLLEHKDDKEVQRRRKIGIANKGKVPWNKGRKHSEATCAKIRQRTKEALKDPKVRKKMSECPRSLSNQTKARIRSSLRKLWGQRLRWKRSREKLMQSWGDSIAEAAKIGGSDQQELDWDSYNKIKEEITAQQLKQAAENAKAKQMARIRAARAAQIRAEARIKRAQQRKLQEEHARLRRQSIRKREKKSEEDKEKLAISHEKKLKERLTKIHRKKSAISQLSSEQQRSWEKLDIHFVKREQLCKEIPLAEQIRYAKNRRAEYATHEASATLSSSHPVCKSQLDQS